MRTILAVMFLAVSAFAQEASVVTAACGPKVDFEVQLDKSQHTLTPPEAGKARVYFIRDYGVVACLGSCGTTKFGLDGAWAGAAQHNSYFSVSVEPGEHHVCADPSTSRQAVALAHFTAEAGMTYYFRMRSFSGQYQQLWDFEAIDSDEGKYLIATYPLSVSHPRR